MQLDDLVHGKGLRKVAIMFCQSTSKSLGRFGGHLDVTNGRSFSRRKFIHQGESRNQSYLCIDVDIEGVRRNFSSRSGDFDQVSSFIFSIRTC
jgi:hypothetical protein